MVRPECFSLDWRADKYCGRCTLSMRCQANLPQYLELAEADIVTQTNRIKDGSRIWILAHAMRDKIFTIHDLKKLSRKLFQSLIDLKLFKKKLKARRLIHVERGLIFADLKFYSVKADEFQ